MDFKEVVHISGHEMPNHRQLAELVLLHLGAGKLVQIPAVLWEATSFRGWVSKFKTKLHTLFPLHTRVVSQKIEENGNTFTQLCWQKKGERYPFLTGTGFHGTIVEELEESDKLIVEKLR